MEKCCESKENWEGSSNDLSIRLSTIMSSLTTLTLTLTLNRDYRASLTLTNDKFK